MAVMYEDSIRDEFTHQTDSFAGSPAMSAAGILDALVELAPADARGPLARRRLRPGARRRGRWRRGSARSTAST